MFLASPFRCRSIDQIYYLWKLAGGDLTAVLKTAGLIKISPSISKISKYNEIFLKNKFLFIYN
jgi:hypothetical protein